MFQNTKHQPILKYYFYLIVLALIAICISACNFENLPNGTTDAPFQLFIFSNNGEKKLLHNASPSEYQDWLNHVDLTNSQFNVDNESISSSINYDENKLYLGLNISASQNIIKLFEPDSDVDAALTGENSIGCSLQAEDEKAFLIMIRRNRIAGGTIRCPTAIVYTHPEMNVVTKQGVVILGITNLDAKITTKIIMGLLKGFDP